MKRSRILLRRMYIAAFMLAAAGAIWLVALQRQESLQAAVPIENRTVVLETSTDKNRASSHSENQQRAKITPLPGEIFLKTIDINLDDDEDFEQLILSKKNAATSSLDVVVADFSATLGIYLRYFDGPIAATKLDSIIFQSMDVTADGLTDLLVQGLNESNDQTLTVFRRLPNRGYSRVFSGIGMEIDLQEPDISVTLASAASILVKARATTPNTAIQSLYIWNSRFLSFEKKSETLVPQNAILVLGPSGNDASAFLTWLNRLWTRNTDVSDIRSLFLDPKGNALILGAGKIQQRWIIKSAERNGNRLYLTCSTSEASDLDRIVVIDAKTQNDIAVGITDQQVSHFRRDEGWAGVYSAIIPDPASTPSSEGVNTDFTSFCGRYLGDNDSVLVLSQTKSVVLIDNHYREGIAKFFDYSGLQVMDFLQILPGGLSGERLIFVVTVEKLAGEKIERIRLDPAHIDSGGVQIDYRTPYFFTKTS